MADAAHKPTARCWGQCHWSLHTHSLTCHLWCLPAQGKVSRCAACRPAKSADTRPFSETASGPFPGRAPAHGNPQRALISVAYMGIPILHKLALPFLLFTLYFFTSSIHFRRKHYISTTKLTGSMCPFYCNHRLLSKPMRMKMCNCSTPSGDTDPHDLPLTRNLRASGAWLAGLSPTGLLV